MKKEKEKKNSPHTQHEIPSNCIRFNYYCSDTCPHVIIAMYSLLKYNKLIHFFMSIFTCCVNNVNLYCHRYCYRYRCCYDTSAHAVVMLLISYRRICYDATHVAMLLLPLLLLPLPLRCCHCCDTATADNTGCYSYNYFAAIAISPPPMLLSYYH